MVERRSPGRPRSERARRAVLEATRDLVLSGGYERLTVEAIAEKAGVGRQTIYRWWSTKVSIIAEAVTEGILTTTAPPENALHDVTPQVWLSEWLRLLADAEYRSLARALIAAAAGDSAQSDALYEFGTRGTRADLKVMLERGVANGIIRGDLDLDVAADALTGAVLFRVLAQVEIPSGYADALLAPLLADPPRHSRNDGSAATDKPGEEAQ